MLRRTTVLLVCFVVLAAAGCGSKKSSTAATAARPTTTTVHFAKTKFVLHAGLAFGAFHHFIYEPFKAGDFSHPFSHKLTIIKAGLAAFFVYHELKLAAADVKGSKVLSALFAPITLLADKVKSMGAAIKGGHASSSDISGVNTGIGQIKSSSAASGQPITEASPSAVAAAGLS